MTDLSDAWGIHLDVPELDFVDGGFISIGWDEIGDLREIGGDKKVLKRRLITSYIGAKRGAIPVWAGILHRFLYEMKCGDLVIYPRKRDRTINLGIVDGDYEWLSSAPTHRHRRRVRWIETELPRAIFSQAALYEAGSTLTLFRVKTHVEEFVRPASSARALPPRSRG